MKPTPPHPRRSNATLRRDIERMRKTVAELRAKLTQERQKCVRLEQQIHDRDSLIDATDRLTLARWQDPGTLRRVNELRSAIRRARIVTELKTA